jgi:hypothetical protein
MGGQAAEIALSHCRTLDTAKVPLASSLMRQCRHRTTYSSPMTEKLGASLLK